MRWIERKRHARRRRRDPELRGLLPASISAEHLGPFDYFYWDDFWALAGLRDGAALLSAAGDELGGDQARQWAARMAARWGESVEVLARSDPLVRSAALSARARQLTP